MRCMQDARLTCRFVCGTPNLLHFRSYITHPQTLGLGPRLELCRSRPNQPDTLQSAVTQFLFPRSHTLTSKKDQDLELQKDSGFVGMVEVTRGLHQKDVSRSHSDSPGATP